MRHHSPVHGGPQPVPPAEHSATSQGQPCPPPTPAAAATAIPVRVLVDCTGSGRACSIPRRSADGRAKLVALARAAAARHDAAARVPPVVAPREPAQALKGHREQHDRHKGGRQRDRRVDFPPVREHTQVVRLPVQRHLKGQQTGRDKPSEPSCCIPFRGARAACRACRACPSRFLARSFVCSKYTNSGVSHQTSSRQNLRGERRRVRVGR